MSLIFCPAVVSIGFILSSVGISANSARLSLAWTLTTCPQPLSYSCLEEYTFPENKTTLELSSIMRIGVKSPNLPVRGPYLSAPEPKGFLEGFIRVISAVRGLPNLSCISTRTVAFLLALVFACTQALPLQYSTIDLAMTNYPFGSSRQIAY